MSAPVAHGGAPPLNRLVTAPVRRRLEQPSEEKARRSGCLVWGAVLGVLGGLMLGIYALPPILKHFYGETTVAADEFYREDGKAIRLIEVRRGNGEDSGFTGFQPREDYYARVLVVVEEVWTADRTDFSLEFEGLENWDIAEPGDELRFEPGAETEVELHFVVEIPEDTEGFAAEALHLSDPPVKFEVAR